MLLGYALQLTLPIINCGHAQQIENSHVNMWNSSTQKKRMWLNRATYTKHIHNKHCTQYQQIQLSTTKHLNTVKTNMPCQCYYRILGFGKGVEFDKTNISKRKKKAQKILHPDKCNHPEAKLVSTFINLAAETLDNDHLWQTYNIFGSKGNGTEHSCQEAKKAIKIIEEILTDRKRHKPEPEVIVITDNEGDNNGDNDKIKEPESPRNTAGSGKDTSTSPNENNNKDDNLSDDNKGDKQQDNDLNQANVGQEDKKDTDRPIENQSPETRPKNDDATNNSQKINDSFRGKVKRILKHRFRRTKNKDEINLLVEYEPYDIEIWEPIEVLIEEYFGLKHYIDLIRKKSKRSLSKILEFKPTLFKDLDDAKKRLENIEN